MELPTFTAFTRLFKEVETLEAAYAMFLAFNNFVWRTREPKEGRTRLLGSPAPFAKQPKQPDKK